MPQAIRNLLQLYVNEIQKIYGSHLRQVILYGSYARGDFKEDADVIILFMQILPRKESCYMRQPYDSGTQRDLVLYKIETSKENLRAAKILFDSKEYKSANNRAYYAIFHSVNAVHALAGKAFKRHKDAIANFNKDYVKTEIFPKEIGRRIAGAG